VIDDKLQLDLGCGLEKRSAYLGLDKIAYPTVDHVLDLEVDALPFEDDTVDSVYSSNFLNMVDQPDHLFSEIGRVCRDGARIEFWTPYAWSNEAFLYGHVHYISEDMWWNLCVAHRDVFAGMLGGRWQLRRLVFVVHEDTLRELRGHGMDVSFGIRHLKGVVRELGVEIEFRRDLDVPVAVPDRVHATSRSGPRTLVDVEVDVSLRERVRARATSLFGQFRP
jgi:SAM-dependent methyltransferase